MRTLTTVLCGLAAGLALAAPAAAQEGKPAAAAAAQGGMKVYLDPQTGALRDTPAPGTAPLILSPQEQNALSTYSGDLEQIPSSLPGGGVMVDLKGRFQSPLMATIGPDGKVRTFHPGEPPRAHAHDAADATGKK